MKESFKNIMTEEDKILRRYSLEKKRMFFLILLILFFIFLKFSIQSNYESNFIQEEERISESI